MNEMKNKALVHGKPSASTQQYLDLAEIKEDVIVLKDGSMRAVILVSSINFSLKSEEEKNAVISGYVQFLNTLQHPVQIVVQSRPLNINKYLDELTEVSKTHTNQLLKTQTLEYQRFLKEMVSLANIMNKKFYFVVPYSPFGDKTRRGFLSQFKAAISSQNVITLKRNTFLRYKEVLDKRVDFILNGIDGMGLTSLRLPTEALIELSYDLYNPEVWQSQPLSDVNNLQVESF